MQILTVVHYSDIPQLLLQAITIRKFWKDTKHWTIVIEDYDPSYCLDACEKISKFMNDWVIEIVVPKSNLNHSGWIRQQVFKLWYSASSNYDWVLVLDCKNFLIRPMDRKKFVTGNKVKTVPLFGVNEFVTSANEKAKEILEIYQDIKYSSSMSPCVLNSVEAKRMITELNINLNSWNYEGATEFTLYQAYTHKKFKYREKQFVSGFWNDIEPSMAKDIADAAKKDKRILFWTHHRYVKSEYLILQTISVLSGIGIRQKFLNLWKARYQVLLHSFPNQLNQDRSNWKNLK